MLDGALLLPIGIWLTLKFVPQPVLDECREKATQWLAEKHGKPHNWLGAAQITRIDDAVSAIPVPIQYSEPYYNLRAHVEYVRRRLESQTAAAPAKS